MPSANSPRDLTNPLANQGRVRTDLHCHNCSKSFIAQLDFDLDGNHEIRCPYCRHIHFRVILKGAITEERFDSDPNVQHIVVGSDRTWRAPNAPIMTSSAAMFLRDRWLNHGQD